jgi:AP-1 complex subunit gamma-1
LLLDLMGGADVPSSELKSTTNGSSSNTADLLADILGGGSNAGQKVAQPASRSANADSIMDLFGTGPPPNGTVSPNTAQQTSSSIDVFSGMASQSSQPQTPASPPTLIAQPVYNKNNLIVTVQVNRSTGGSTSTAQLLARFRNTSSFDRLSGVGLQAAVPKSQKLVLQTISRSVLEAGEEATQAMRVASVSGVS